MASEGRFDKQILRVSREEFSQHGYFGARIDSVAKNAKVNKRMIYEFCHTKEGLYMITLSDVSREAMSEFQEILPQIKAAESVRAVYSIFFNLLEGLDAFLRLWAWERMAPTIHGPRILETASAMFEQLRAIVAAQLKVEESAYGDVFEAVEALCHGYMRCKYAALTVWAGGSLPLRGYLRRKYAATPSETEYSEIIGKTYEKYSQIYHCGNACADAARQCLRHPG